MKKLQHIALAVVTAFACLTGFSLNTYAEGALNTFEKDFTYERGDKTYGAHVTISSSRAVDWNLEFDKKNDEAADNFVYYRLIADGEPGDVIDVNVTSEYPDTLLGITILPKINGSWKTGTQKTLFVSADENALTDSATIGDDVSDLQVSVCAYSKAFSSKEPGSMDIILTIETPLHEDIAPSDGSGTKFFGTIILSVLVLVGLAIFLGKRNARKNAK